MTRIPVQLGLGTYTFLTPGFSMQRTNVYAGAKEQILKGFSNMPEIPQVYPQELSAAGIPDLFVAQMIGHSSPSILQTYSKAIDEYRRDAVRKLEQMRQAHTDHTTMRTSSSSTKGSDDPSHQVIN
jgi:hypothetical protein